MRGTRQAPGRTREEDRGEEYRSLLSDPSRPHRIHPPAQVGRRTAPLAPTERTMTRALFLAHREDHRRHPGRHPETAMTSVPFLALFALLRLLVGVFPAKAAQEPPTVPEDFAFLFQIRHLVTEDPEGVLQRLDPKALRNHRYAGELHLFAARAALRLEKHALAATHFRAAAQRSPEIAAYALEEMAQALEGGGNPTAAIPLYQEIAEAYRQVPIHLPAQRAAARLYHDVGRPGIAIVSLDRLLETPLRVEALLDKSTWLEEIGNREGALAILLALREELPPQIDEIERRLAHFAQEEALPPEPAASRRNRARRLRRLGRFDLAWAALAPLLSGDADLDREIHFEAGYTLFRMRDYRRALEEFQAYEAAGGKKGKALFWIAFTLSRLGDFQASRAHYEMLISLLPTTSYAEEARFKLGLVAEELGERERAIEAYEAVVRRASRFAPDARWRLAWIAFSNGAFAEAVEHLDASLGGKIQDEEAERALYWKGRALAALDRPEAAQEAYRRLLSEAPDTYYGALARLRLGAGNDLAFLQRLFPERTRRGEISSGALREVFAPDRGKKEPRFPLHRETLEAAYAAFHAFEGALETFRYEGMEEIRRAAHLLLIGRPSDARLELRGVESRNPHDERFLRWLAPLYLHTKGFHRLVRLAENDLAGRLKPPVEANRPLWRLAYPAAYADVLRSVCEGQPKLDPWMLTALMRTESHFDPQARSPVGALGIAQIMPETGRRLAEALHLTPFSPEMLFDPEVSILLAAHYLRRLLHLLGTPLPAIAAYNAGEAKVAEWLSRWGDLPMDAFLESMSYAETRNYVKTVTRDWLRYRSLYGKHMP
ncbi:MAG: hypothetical protein D6812_14760 [Deltaproteobacteria bacterium]|nr:MAG: hypothetical protein D6812_14760 [Deltaproteobacteria bacterium]